MTFEDTGLRVTRERNIDGLKSYSEWLFKCRTCGSLVTEDAMAQHRDWHIEHAQP
jgi:hypothetical protein